MDTLICIASLLTVNIDIVDGYFTLQLISYSVFKKAKQQVQLVQHFRITMLHTESKSYLNSAAGGYPT